MSFSNTGPFDVCFKDLQRVTVKFLVSNFFNKSIRRTKHYQEWLRMPMNYVRQAEIPLVLSLLNPSPNEKVLDVSSPKLLALYMALKNFKVCATDADPYFVDDFCKYADLIPGGIELEMVDVRNMPFESGSFDKIFSISVLEHIPGDGDKLALLEVNRVLSEKGACVISLPAFHKPLQEWQVEKKFYWESVTDSNGRHFYQRRYDRDQLSKLAEESGFQIEEVTYIAERPIVEPELDSNGTLIHNSGYIDTTIANHWVNHTPFKLLPLLPYIVSRNYSKKYHYLTKDYLDRNIRQVVLKLTKAR
ncbi:MAG: methyltransferase domain-containing protein [Imperialibacter sp.]|uniref:class I SAM-dependent methyltransferase n=1 Tax=Imperialibacter sp. TaxID=2038411 RepID=UPI0032EF34E6